jgi:hypothetical protein
MFRFRDDVPDERITDVCRRLRQLPHLVETIRTYEVGRDLGLRPGTWDLVVIGGFDDVDGFRTYATHPEHVAVVDDINRIVLDRASLQSEIAE